MKNKKSQPQSPKTGKSKLNQSKPLTPPWRLIFAGLAVYIGVGAVLYFRTHTPNNPVAVDVPPPPASADHMPVVPEDSGRDMKRALELDSQSFGLYNSGQYEPSLRMLEESIEIYQQNLVIAKAKNDDQLKRQLETLVAENHQHIGKCYVMLARQVKDQPEKQNQFYQSALRNYRAALPFYKRYGNYKGSSMGEMVMDFSALLTELHNDEELEKLKVLARLNNIEIKG